MNRAQLLEALQSIGKTGIDDWGQPFITHNDLIAFASRIESLVREKCAQVCESFCDGNSMTANELADIIRKSEG
jgi:hypothetical protein